MSLILGVAAGYYASHYANSLTDKLTQRIFGLAPTAALDRAYEFMMLSPNCTNAEVNRLDCVSVCTHSFRSTSSIERLPFFITRIKSGALPNISFC